MYVLHNRFGAVSAFSGGADSDGDGDDEALSRTPLAVSEAGQDKTRWDGRMVAGGI